LKGPYGKETGRVICDSGGKKAFFLQLLYNKKWQHSVTLKTATNHVV